MAGFDETAAGPLLESLLLKQAALEHQLDRLDAEPGELFSFHLTREIAAGETFRVPLAVAQPHTLVAYEFSVEPKGYDIGFDLVHPGAGDEKPVRMVPPPLAGPGFGGDDSPLREVAAMTAERAGTYVLVFDNSHSMFTPKHIDCHVNLREPRSRPAQAARAWLALTPGLCTAALALRGSMGARARIAANDAAVLGEVEARVAALEARRSTLLELQLARTAHMRGKAPQVMQWMATQTGAAAAAAATAGDVAAQSMPELEGEGSGEAAGVTTSAQGVAAEDEVPAVVTAFEALKRESELTIAQIERLRHRLLQLEGAHAALKAQSESAAEYTAKCEDETEAAALAQKLRVCLAKCPLKD